MSRASVAKVSASPASSSTRVPDTSATRRQIATLRPWDGVTRGGIASVDGSAVIGLAVAVGGAIWAGAGQRKCACVPAIRGIEQRI